MKNRLIGKIPDLKKLIKRLALQYKILQALA